VAVLLGAALAVTFWPNTGSGPATRAVVTAEDGRQDAFLALRAEERTSRDWARSPGSATPVGKPSPAPAVVGQSASKPKAKPATPGVSNAPCPISSGLEVHLTSNARAVYRAVCAAFGSTVSSFGGYRAGDPGDHGSGRAVDIMVSGAPGWDIARYVQAHARELGVTYVIYQQKIWLAGNPTSQWKAMEDRGSITANHYDHVHVSVS
jgi:hypothetical protein